MDWVLSDPSCHGTPLQVENYKGTGKGHEQCLRLLLRYSCCIATSPSTYVFDPLKSSYELLADSVCVLLIHFALCCVLGY